MKLQLQPNEQVIKASDTNHFLTNEETIDGKLVLTNQKRLYFKSGEERGDQFDKTLSMQEIRDVMYFKTGLFSKGLRLLTANGDDLRFKLKGLDSWAKALTGMI